MMQNLNSTTVLTTAERADYLRLACGPDADYRIDPRRTIPLADFLANLVLAGGGTVVLDEDHFVHADDLRRGLRTFLNSGMRGIDLLRVVVVCSHRHAPDDMLHFLTGYCALYDVVCEVDGPGIGRALSEILDVPRRRCDVLELLEAPAPELAEHTDGKSAGPVTVDIRIRVSHAGVRVEGVEAVGA